MTSTPIRTFGRRWRPPSASTRSNGWSISSLVRSRKKEHAAVGDSTCDHRITELLLDCDPHGVRLIIRNDETYEAPILRCCLNHDRLWRSAPIMRKDRADDFASGFTVAEFHLFAGDERCEFAKVLHGVARCVVAGAVRFRNDVAMS